MKLKTLFVCLAGLLFFVPLSVVPSYAMVEVTLFGPQTYEREKGKPFSEIDNFSIAGLTGTGQLIIQNGGDDKKTRVSSAEIWFNGYLIFSQNDFNKNVEHLVAEVPLAEDNEISVKLNGKPGSYLTAELMKEEDAHAAAVCGPEGGMVEVTDPNSNLLGVIVNVPPSALNEDTIVSIKEVDIVIALPQGTVTGSPAIDLGPDGTLFNNNIQITIPYDDADNDGIVDYTGDSEDDISCVLWDDTNQTWIGLNIISQDTQNNTITVETNHFTWLVLICDCVPRDDVVIFTIDGLNFVKTIFIERYPQYLIPGDIFGQIMDIWDHLPRKKYLNKSIYRDMNLGLNKCDVIPYTWSGNAYDTPDIMSNLISTLENEYNNAGGKKFILVTHSWGTRLGSLALRYSGKVVPDLFITLSDPSASISVDDTMHTNTIFHTSVLPIPVIPVSEVHFWIDNFVTNIEQETSDAMGGVPAHYLQAEKWINYWDVGDIFSGPLDLNSLDANWEDRTVRGDTVRTFGTTTEVHAITSLSKDKWESLLLQYDVVEEGEEFRDKVEADIKAVIGCHKLDFDCSGCIEIDELLIAIEMWKAGEITITEIMVAIGIWKACTSANTLSDDFEDGVIDTNLWVIGGAKRGWNESNPSDDGNWSISQNETIAPDGYLNMRVWGPGSANTYGAEAWVRTEYDFNDSNNHTINFVWQPDFVDWHYNYFFIQVTDGFISSVNNLHWNLSEPPGTVNLLRNPDGSPGRYFENEPSPGKLSWSITLEPSGIARLYDGPDATGNLLEQQNLDTSYPWYIRFMVSDGTSMGFPAGDAWLNLYEFVP